MLNSAARSGAGQLRDDRHSPRWQPFGAVDQRGDGDAGFAKQVETGIAGDQLPFQLSPRALRERAVRGEVEKDRILRQLERSFRTSIRPVARIARRRAASAVLRAGRQTRKIPTATRREEHRTASLRAPPPATGSARAATRSLKTAGTAATARACRDAVAARARDHARGRWSVPGRVGGALQADRRVDPPSPLLPCCRTSTR